jgi:hypothetical protein
MKDGLVVDGGSAPSFPAAMAAVAILGNQSLGRLSPDQTSADFDAAFNKKVKTPYVKGEAVASFLRRLWLQPEANDCLAALAVSRIATLALMAGPKEGAPDSLKALLAAAQLAQVDEPVEGNVLDAAQKAVFGSGALPNGARFVFLTGKTDVAQDGGNQRLFNPSRLGPPISVQVQTPDRATIFVTIDDDLRRPLGFVNV